MSMRPPAFLVALLEVLIADGGETPAPAEHAAALEYAVTFSTAQFAALPAVLRAALRAGLIAFRVDVAMRHGRGFCSLPTAQRAAAVERWAASSVVPQRQLFRLLRNLALLAYYERLTEVPAATPARTAASVSATPVTDASVEILVIGSGAGGAVTALELAQRGRSVMIVEEGDATGAAPFDPGATDTMARLYRHRGMTPIVGHVPIAYVEGRCVGGSTEINSGFWHRPPLEAVLRWKAQYDLDCGGLEELRPHWEWAEELLDVGTHRGHWPPNSQAFADGARAMGWVINEVPRTAAHARRGEAAGATPGPGMSRSLLPRALAAGARLMSSCRVDVLERDGGRVVAAVVRRRNGEGETETVRIKAEQVFVCAGPTETPSLLRRSGVTRHVGDSLRIHPMIKLAALFPTRMHSGPDTMPLLQVKEFWPEIVLGGAYFSPGHLAVVMADNWPETRHRMRDSANMACYYVGVRGTGHGRVRPSRLDSRHTEIRYELSDQDMWNLSRGVARLATLLLEGGATEVLPAVRGMSAIRSDVEAIRWLDDQLERRACSLTTVHAFSSCPIGERRDRCAADSFGKVHGYDNLYINDASMIPDSPGVNPQGTIMTFARRNALHFADVN